MEFLKSCMNCGAVHDLDTIMDVKYEGEKHKVAICALCEDDVSPKIIKEKLGKTFEEINHILERAEQLGLYIYKEPRVIASEAAVPVPTPAPAVAEKEEEVEEAKSKKTEASGEQRKANSSDSSGAKKSISIDEYDRSKTQAEFQDLNYECGGRTTVPKKIESELGTTEIVISKTTDRDIQDLTKATGPDGESIYNSNFLSECTLCGGSGIARIGGKACHKCGGTGVAKR